MVETNVPKDIRVYKTKVLGPFTLRQAICIAICCMIDIFIYLIIGKPMNIPAKLLMWIIIIVDIPVLAFMVEIDGMAMEVYLKEILLHNFIAPTKRKAITAISEEEKEMSESDRKKIEKKMNRLLKSHPEYKAYK